MTVSWTPLQTKQAVTFFDPNNPTNLFSPKLNPATAAYTPGNVRKYINTTNAGAVIVGDREYPPMELKIAWDELDDSDWQQLKLFAAISPVVFVDNNDNGFMGVFMIDSVGQIAGKAAKVYQVQCSFLVISPYNGILNPIGSLHPPNSFAGAPFTNDGFIKNNHDLYFWPTIFTWTGESAIGTVVHVNTGTGGSNTNRIVLSYSGPFDGHSIQIPYVKLRVYWNNINDPTTCTFLTDIQASFSNSFTVFGDYTPYSAAQPPNFGTSFTGYWAGSNWIQTASN